MNKVIKSIFLFLLIGILIFSVVYPNIYWFINSKLTKMELLVKFWYFVPIAIISGLISLKLFNNV